MRKYITPFTLGGQKKFGGESYSFVANFGTKAEAEANARLQRKKAKMKARIWKWKRDDGNVLYAVYIRRSKYFRF